MAAPDAAEEAGAAVTPAALRPQRLVQLRGELALLLVELAAESTTLTTTR